MSVFFLQVLKKQIKLAEFDALAPFYQIMAKLLFMKDSLQTFRIGLVVPKLLKIIEKFKKYPKYTRESISQFFMAADNNQTLLNWLEREKDSWTWIEEWLETQGMKLVYRRAKKASRNGRKNVRRISSIRVQEIE